MCEYYEPFKDPTEILQGPLFKGGTQYRLSMNLTPGDGLSTSVLRQQVLPLLVQTSERTSYEGNVFLQTILDIESLYLIIVNI